MMWYYTIKVVRQRMTKPEDEPYALKMIEERQRRIAMLGQPHIEPLAKYLAAIKAEHSDKDLPCFDPCDGGIHAKVLFLLEAPGPKAVDSAFISRNNPDPAARNMNGLLSDAKISRIDTLLWNIVPWYVGASGNIRLVNSADISESFPYLAGLLALLPDLKVIALVGRKTQSARNQIAQLTPVPIVAAHHPSARVFNVWPHKKDEMREQLSEVASYLAGE